MRGVASDRSDVLLCAATADQMLVKVNVCRFLTTVIRPKMFRFRIQGEENSLKMRLFEIEGGASMAGTVIAGFSGGRSSR